MSKKIVKKLGIFFELNETYFTASIIGVNNARGTIMFPCSKFDESNEYFITKIKEGSFKYNDNINTIIFPDDSKLQIIEKKSFFRSSIQSITIPSSVELLQEGWCSNTNMLTKVFISPNNKIYSYVVILNKQ